MQTIFKYNNTLHQCMNLLKKLKRMKLSESDIDIIWQGECTQSELEKRFNALNNSPKSIEEQYNDIILYTFSNGKSIIKSIYNNLEHLKTVINVEEYSQIY